MGNGSSVTQVNSTVDTGSLLLRSGGDTTLAGAQVRADEINALIDGNLNTQDQKSKQDSGGFGASICIPPICYGTPVAASANLAAGNMNSEYKGVTDQTGLFAGAGGYTVDVGKTTTLEGGVIASDASAEKNLLITDRLIARDIKNVSEIEAQSAGISVSASYGGAGATASVGGLYGIALSESDKSHTRSAVSEGTIIVRNPEGAQDTVGLNRDTKNANERLDKPDEDAMNERIELVKSSVELVKGVGDAVAAAKIDEAKDQNSEAFKAARQKLNDSGVANPTSEQISQQVQHDYGIGSSFQKASQAVTGIIQGVLSGNIGAAVGGGAAPYLAQAIKQRTEGDEAANLMAHAVLGAVLAKTQQNSALAGAAGASIGELIANQLFPGKSSDQLSEADKETISALSTLAGGLAGGLVGGDSANAVAGAGAAKNAAENNAMGMMAGGDFGFWLADVKGCDSACKADIAKQTAEGGVLVSGAMLASTVAAVGAVATPELIAAAQTAARACSANPVLCANETTVWLAEMAASEALPAGLAVGGAAKLTAEQLRDARALMVIETQTGKKITSEALGIALGKTGSGTVVGDELAARLTPQSFGFSTVADNPQSLQMWNDAMRCVPLPAPAGLMDIRDTLIPLPADKIPASKYWRMHSVPLIAALLNRPAMPGKKSRKFITGILEKRISQHRWLTPDTWCPYLHARPIF